MVYAGGTIQIIVRHIITSCSMTQQSGSEKSLSDLYEQGKLENKQTKTHLNDSFQFY